MTETEQFLATMSSRITEAEIALHNGDSGPRIAMWSRAEPLTLFGAAMSGYGWNEIGPIFGALGEQFSNCLSYENQIIATEARGDLAISWPLSLSGTGRNPGDARARRDYQRDPGHQWWADHREQRTWRSHLVLTSCSDEP
jgi:hypothetical protein